MRFVVKIRYVKKYAGFIICLYQTTSNCCLEIKFHVDIRHRFRSYSEKNGGPKRWWAKASRQKVSCRALMELVGRMTAPLHIGNRQGEQTGGF